MHKKAKPWRILVIVVKWRHHANGLLTNVWELHSVSMWIVIFRNLRLYFGAFKTVHVHCTYTCILRQLIKIFFLSNSYATEKLQALIHIWTLKKCPRSLIGDLSQARGTLLVWQGINTFLNTAVLAGLMGQLVPCPTESTSLGMESGQAISYQCRMSWTVVRKLHHRVIDHLR